jgi:hypothetical protein
MGSDNLFSIPSVNIRPPPVIQPLPLHIYEVEEEAKVSEPLNPRLSNAPHDLEAIHEEQEEIKSNL